MTVLTEAPEAFDFIVVGGGTAGCVVAGRLAENPDVKVLVIEAGIGNPKDVDAITTPARAFELRGSKYDWSYKTGMIDRPEYTRIEKPNTRGKVLGGSSCLNYYTWIPGSKAIFDEWATWGGEEWAWDTFKHYLYKPATYHDDNNVYSPELKYMGAGGPLPVSHSDLLPESAPFRDAMEKAWLSKGEVLTDDVHNGSMHGLWKCTNSIYNGKRSSSWMFLEGKKNVVVLAQANAKRLIVEDGKATGVEVIGPDGTTTLSFRAKHEVVVSLGVFESPKLLMLSGIGRGADLANFGIETVVDSGHVGQNLLDHPILPHVFKLKDGYGLDNHLLRAGLEKDGATAAYRWKNKGPYTSGLLELVALPRIDKWLADEPAYQAAKAANGGVDPYGPTLPHFEIDLVNMFCDAFQWHIPTPPQGDYFTVIVDLLRPLSRAGTVVLNSTDPLEQPKVDINFFANDLDLVIMRQGVRFIDDIIRNGEGMKDIIEGDYPWPMPRASDEAMETLIKERSQTGFHPCGTNRMAKSIEDGVVDGQLKVFGVNGLRVIDASVIPVIPDCRIQQSVYAIGEKGADMIKAAHPDLYS